MLRRVGDHRRQADRNQDREAQQRRDTHRRGHDPRAEARGEDERAAPRPVTVRQRSDSDFADCSARGTWPLERSRVLDAPDRNGRWDRNGSPSSRWSPCSSSARVLPINMGALAYVAAWLVGMYSLDLDEKEILAGVSGDLMLTLIGVTYLFAIARNNGTVDLIVQTAVRAVGGRVALIPWVMFARDRPADRDRRRQSRLPARSSARSPSASPAATASTR